VAVVLIVEDEAQVLVMIDFVLAEAGYETLTARTLAEGLAITQSEKKIDLLFTDLTLVDEIDGGLQLGRAFAETRPQTPVLYTTGRGVTDGMLELFVKPYGFVAKPYTPENVLTAVKNLLGAVPT